MLSLLININYQIFTIILPILTDDLGLFFLTHGPAFEFFPICITCMRFCYQDNFCQVNGSFSLPSIFCEKVSLDPTPLLNHLSSMLNLRKNCRMFFFISF